MKKNFLLLLIFLSGFFFSQEYKPDILGNGFEQKTLNFPNDYEGKVTATVIRKKAASPAKKAVLYIHGFNDYFFQAQMAEKFNEKGFDFYALDLRKYGRSYLPHQTFNNVRNLDEYNAEIDEALKIIAAENHNKILLAGHSTGGLITTRYLKYHPENPNIAGLWVNSPFYDFNMGFLAKKIGVRIISGLGKHHPDTKIGGGFSTFYGESLHKDFKGEWNYDLKLKPNANGKVNFGFIRAIHRAQKDIRNAELKVPVLVMHSEKSGYPKVWNEEVTSTDIILNVKYIHKNAENFRGNVTVIPVKGGIHDLVLSRKPVREKVYNELFSWLQKIDF